MLLYRQRQIPPLRSLQVSLNLPKVPSLIHPHFDSVVTPLLLTIVKLPRHPLDVSLRLPIRRPPGPAHLLQPRSSLIARKREQCVRSRARLSSRTGVSLRRRTCRKSSLMMQRRRSWRSRSAEMSVRALHHRS